MANLLLFNYKPVLITASIVLGVFLLLMLICFLFTLLIFKKAFGRSEKTPSEGNELYKQYDGILKEGEEFFFSLNPEEVYITSNDNLKLHAYFHETENSIGTIIFMHGYHGKPVRDFGPVLSLFKELGFSLLLPHQRAHGKSEGKYLTFGVKESEDCLLWAKYIASRFPGRPISLHGISMGGATVGMASALDLPKEVQLIANDCGFTSPDAIISSVRKSMKLPAFPFQFMVRFLAKTLAKFSLKQKDASICYSQSTLPALFIHGEADDFVPFYMGKQNYEKCASQDKILISVKDAGHALAYILDKERVTKEIKGFYLYHMQKKQ